MKEWIGRRFDNRFHVDTLSEVSVEDLDISSDEINEAVEYTSTPATFGYILSLLPIEYADYVFIDYGSGRGKVLFMASDFPFQKIWGVEISSMLCESANKNIESYRSNSQKCLDLEISCSDAKIFKLPERPLILYFYNPFSENIMQEVLDSVEVSISETPRPIYLIYYNPKHKELMDKMEQFYRITIDGCENPLWVIYHSKDGR